MTFAAGSVHRAPEPVILEDIMWVQSLRCEHVAVTVSRKAGASKICNRGLWKEVMRARWQSQALSLDLEEFGLNVAAVMYQAIPAVDLLRRRSWDMLAQAFLSYRDLENQNMERPNNSLNQCRLQTLPGFARVSVRITRYLVSLKCSRNQQLRRHDTKARLTSEGCLMPPANSLYCRFACRR